MHTKEAINIADHNTADGVLNETTQHEQKQKQKELPEEHRSTQSKLTQSASNARWNQALITQIINKILEFLHKLVG